jgi:SAM-dependent methyltransferase
VDQDGKGMSGESTSTAAYDRNVDFYVDFVDRGLKSNAYVSLLTLMTELIGARLKEARVCDLCCGEGYLGRHLIAHGAHEVLGIDLSAELLERAMARAKLPNLSYHRDDAQKLSSLADGAFDVVASQLAMMDVADHRALFAAVRRVLVPRGVFVFSTLHPCFKARPFHVRDAPENLLDEQGQPIGVVVRRYASEGYFSSGGDGVRGRMGSYHRMLSSYVNDLISAGFVLERLEEPLDGPENGALFSEVPMVLVIAARSI